MIPRRSLPAVILGLALMLSQGCDTSGSITIVPELELTSGFEDGLSPWEGRQVGVSVGSGVELVTEPVSSGARAVRVTLDGDQGGAVWMEREVELSPEILYDVTLIYDVASWDAQADDAWTVIAGVTAFEPEGGALPAAGNTGKGNLGQPLWETRTRTVQIRADELGRLWVVLGIRGGGPGVLSYAFDGIEMRFQRAGG